MNEIDRLNLMQAAKDNPNKAIVFENGFLDGTDAKPFGLVPNHCDGETLFFYYPKGIA